MKYDVKSIDLAMAIITIAKDCVYKIIKQPLSIYHYMAESTLLGIVPIESHSVTNRK